MNSKHSEANDYGHGVDLLITHTNCVFRVLHGSGCREKSTHLRHVYLNLQYMEGFGPLNPRGVGVYLVDNSCI